MAAYVEEADFAGMGLPQRLVDSLDAGVLAAALENASRTVDSYIGARYRMPIAAWGNDIEKCVCDLAAYSIMQRRGFAPGAGDAEQLRQRYEDAIGWLKDVARGVASPFGIQQASVTDSTDQTTNAISFVTQSQSGTISTVQTDCFTISTSSNRRGW